MRLSPLFLLFALGCRNDQELVAQEVVYAPSLSVTAPAGGSWADDGMTTLTASLSDIASVTINGEAHAAAEDFSAPVLLDWGINHLETEAVGLDGSVTVDRRAVLAGDFAAAEGAIGHAAAVRLNQGGLDEVAAVAAGMIDATTLADGLGDMNPVVDLDYAMGTGASVDLDRILFDAPTLDLTATDGALALTVLLPSLYIDSDVTTSLLWIETDHDLEMFADWAVIEADVALSLVDGVVEVELLDPAVSLEGFEYDVSIFPGEVIEDNVFDDTIREAIEDALVDEMTTMIPEALAGLQDGLDLSITTELLGTELTVRGAFADLTVDADGLALGIDVDIEVPEQRTGGGTLTLAAETPEVDRTADAALVLADDLLNRGLYELWAGGLLSQSLSTLDGSLDPESLSSFGISTATITTEATLPPVIVAVDDQLKLQIGGLEVSANTPGFGMGENITLGVTATASIGLSFDGGQLAPVITDLTLNPAIVEMDWEHDPEAVLELLSGFLTPDLVLGAVDGVAFEVPALAGIVLSHADISHSGAHSGLELSLAAQ